MANAVRVRVELKRKYNDSDKNFREMFREFKRRVSNAGILHDVKEHQYYESKSEKERKARKETDKKQRQATLEEKISKAASGTINKIMSGQTKVKKKGNYRQKR